MSTPVHRIANAESLLEVFGYWPSFHDAEVTELRLERTGKGPGPSATITIHVFEMTNEVKPDGYFLCHKHSLVTLACSGIEELSLDGFNHQNALSGLLIEECAPNGRLRVTLDNAYGVDGVLVCNELSVQSVVPGIPEGSVHAR